MLSNMFSLFFGLHCETEILEACEWDEERAEEVGGLFSGFINSCVEQGIIERDIISKKLAAELGTVLNESESKVFLSILDRSIENAPFLLSSEGEYEN